MGVVGTLFSCMGVYMVWACMSPPLDAAAMLGESPAPALTGKPNVSEYLVGVSSFR